jgi:hypothetical protein
MFSGIIHIHGEAREGYQRPNPHRKGTRFTNLVRTGNWVKGNRSKPTKKQANQSKKG